MKDAEKREGKNKLILFPFLGDCGIITISAKVLRTTKGRPVVVCLMTDDTPGYPPDCDAAACCAENLPNASFLAEKDAPYPKKSSHRRVGGQE